MLQLAGVDNIPRLMTWYLFLQFIQAGNLPELTLQNIIILKRLSKINEGFIIFKLFTVMGNSVE